MTGGSSEDDAMFERLSAYVDGALDPDARAEIDALAARDRAVAERTEEIRALDAMLKAAHPAPSGDAAHRRLEALIRAAPTPLGSAARDLRRRRATLSAVAAGAAAAAVAAALLVFGREAPEPAGAGARHIALGAVAPDAPLAKALSTSAYGATVADGVVKWQPRGLFVDAAGRICREFQAYETPEALELGLACRENGGWRVEFAALAPSERGAAAAEPDPFLTPADGPGLDALGVYIRSIGGGAQLSADEEAELLERWRTDAAERP